jgi:hypothetical protein
LAPGGITPMQKFSTSDPAANGGITELTHLSFEHFSYSVTEFP